MKKSHSHETGDILDEPYKGPGAIAAAAGYVSLYHWVAMVAGFIVFGALGMLAEKPTNAVKDAFTEFSVANKSSKNWLKKAPAYVAGWVTRSADYIAHKVVGLGKNVVRGGVQAKPMSEQKLSAFMFAGGVGGAAGWIGSTVWGLIQGGHEGNNGKRQFNRAKAEIKDLRARNDALEKKQAESTPATDTDEKLANTDAHEAPHAVDPHHDKPAHSIHAHGEHAAEHHGKVHDHPQHERAAHSHA